MRIVRKMAVAGLVLGLGAVSIAAQASDDPIETRKAIMSSVGAAAGLGGGMMKAEIDYVPAAGKAAIATVRAASLTFGDYYPAGSDQGDTGAAAAIWEDPDGFAAELAKFQAATEKAAAASGKDGPADLDAFKGAMGPVLATCKSCHETYRKKN
ncbi:cytochrome c [Roseibium porphyridii]|uniref:Cytochrome c n=1 Tax=Roseibium porphyridii TaxID=2866279 RepID=A0ABY8F9E5_9HYPH|nr:MULTISPECIES: cytochrome c [Stappiaceae]QFT31537.1 Cytochrome c-554 precursor [Labrenzia sp. THAF82]WFE92127.1 cytochrome c [Roseibium sp. KMA01]